MVRVWILVAAIFALFVFHSNLLAAVSAVPKYIFLDPSKRSVKVSITNQDPFEVETWVEFKFGYLTSDDLGNLQMLYDTLSTGSISAESWLKSYPQRFVLGPNETQTVRITASPPPGLREGEYWSRIIVSSKPRNPPQIKKDTAGFKTGVVMVSQLGLAFHYRVGKMSTGLSVTSFTTSPSVQGVDAILKLERMGNASYWGTRIYKLIDSRGKVVQSWQKFIVVYKTITIHDMLKVSRLSSGQYTLDVEFVTDKRTDLTNADLIKSPPVRSSSQLIIPE